MKTDDVPEPLRSSPSKAYWVASGGQHGPPLALEALQGVHALVGLRRPPRREGAAVAAVEDEHLAAGGGGVHRVVELGRGDGGEEQRLAAGVGHGQVQPASSSFSRGRRSRAGRGRRAGTRVEVGDRLADHVVRLVDQHRDVEAGDVRVLEDGGERFRVVLRGGEPAQAASR